jgi:hypothetical protein
MRLTRKFHLKTSAASLPIALWDRVNSRIHKPFDYENLPAMTSGGQAGEIRTNVADYAPGLNTSFNFGGAPAAPTYDTNYRDTVANSLMERMMPVQDYQNRQLQTQLSNQGFKLGSEGYKRGLAELGERQAAERYNAYDTAGNEAQRMYGAQMGARQQGISEAMSQGNFNNQALGQAQNLDINAMNAMNAAQGQQFALNQSYANQQNTLRQQAIAEQAQRRGMSLNEMNALMSGQQVNMPNMPQFNQAGISQTPNLMGAMQNTYQANLDAANAKNAGISNAFGGLTSLGAGALSGRVLILRHQAQEQHSACWHSFCRRGRLRIRHLWTPRARRDCTGTSARQT